MRVLGASFIVLLSASGAYAGDAGPPHAPPQTSSSSAHPGLTPQTSSSSAHPGLTPAPSSPLPSPSSSPIPQATRQLLVVQAPSWTSVIGELQRFERSATHPWKALGAAVPVNLGRNGMAWGRGLQPEEAGSGPTKREGDQKSPAGIFLLGTAFGYGDEMPEGSKRYPYLALHGTMSCIEDRRSKYYNQLVDPTVTASDWTTRSEMHRPDGLFRWGLVIMHNAGEVQPGAGSCIFLHIWRGLGRGTAGCTATAPKDVEETLGWLDPDSHPVLVQLPEPEYTRLRTPWSLP